MTIAQSFEPVLLNLRDDHKRVHFNNLPEPTSDAPRHRDQAARARALVDIVESQHANSAARCVIADGAS